MTESQATRPLAGGERAFKRRWRLPIAYRAIAGTALLIDIGLIAGCALAAEFLYRRDPYAVEGEFSHSMAAAIFVAMLFVAAMRVQKLYNPTQLVIMEDQTRSVLR